jgi:hypothetical protein
MTLRALPGLLLGACLPLAAVQAAEVQSLAITDQEYHLGIEGLPEWEHFEGKTPHGRELELRFEARANAAEQTLFIRQRDVKYGWDVLLNRKRLGRLAEMHCDLVTSLAVPPGALNDGENILAIRAPKAIDDILISDVRLDPRPREAALNQCTVSIQVTERTSGAALPARITIVDEQGALIPFHLPPDPSLAIRVGVIYSRDGKAEVGLPPGRYTVYGSRGFEYSVATQTVALARGDRQEIRLEIHREVPTPGLAAADTHIHTLTFSKHGDATIEESMITIAGEGIELAVATDHNHHTDFEEPAIRLNLRQHFTPVMGNEVTTQAGHFNAFPIQPGSTLPDHTLTNWPQLMQSIRSKTGARVIVLNHPRDMHSNFIPFGDANYNAVTGESRHGIEFSFDAVEVVTSAALQSDIMRLFHDWFAMLNHGYRVTGLGASDTHTVSQMILGHARSYVVCDDSDPARIDLDEAVRSFQQGRVLVSMGLLTDLKVDRRFSVGDLATGLDDEIQVEITVLGPSWATTDRVELFANGQLIREQTLAPAPGAVEKARLTWNLPRPTHDVHLVAVATGPGITAPFWELPRPYQASSKTLNPRVIGATNPIWIDGDGDGRFTAARQYASELVRRHTASNELLTALGRYDRAVAIQAAGLLHRAGRDVRAAPFAAELNRAPTAVQEGFAKFISSLPQ